MGKKIDPAWLSLIFAIPGLLLIAFLGPLYAGYSPRVTSLILQKAGLGNLGAAIGLIYFLWVIQVLLFIPALFLLSKSQNKLLARKIRAFFILLALVIFLPSLYLWYVDLG